MLKAAVQGTPAAAGIDDLSNWRWTQHTTPLIVIWDNSPAYRGPELRQYLMTLDLKLPPMALPAYSLDLNLDTASGTVPARK